MLRAVTDTALYASFFIALCASALAAETYLLLGVSVPWRLLAFIGAGTLFIYTAHALVKPAKSANALVSARQLWINRNRSLLKVVSLSGLAIALGVLATGTYSLHFWLWMAHLAFIAIAYTVPVFKRRGKWLALRNVPLLKVFLIAYVWAAVTVQLPLLEQGQVLFQPQFRHLFPERFLFILALALLFDIRDLSLDRNLATLTLPGLIGDKPARALSVILLLIFCVMAFLNYPLPLALPLVFSALAAILVAAIAHTNRSDHFFSGLADGMMLLQAILVAVSVAIFR